MHASASLAVGRTPDAARSRITRLHSDPPLVLRPTHPFNPTPLQQWHQRGAPPIHVSLAAGAAGPIGGDHLRLSIEVGAGAALVLRGVAATLVLPGPHGQPSCTETSVRVAEGGILVWLPGPVIAAQNCHHHAFTQVMLEAGARLLLREELLLGRHGEQPGQIRQRLRVCLDTIPLYDQELSIGPGAVGWDGPAVTGGRRALGTALLVAPDAHHDQVNMSASLIDADTALLPLDGPAVLVTALAADGLALHHQLNGGIQAIESRLWATDESD